MCAMRVLAILIAFCATAMAEHGTLIVHFLGLPVGQETYDLTDNVLHASFEYTERGSKIAATATLRMQPDLTPIQFDVHGKSYRPFSVDASVTPGPQPGPFFTISGYSPLSVQMMMLRYWLRHGKPKRMAQLPAGTPDADLTVDESGHDTVDGIRLTRYSIGNVVWGRETVWLNDRGGIAAAATYAGNLPLEAVREEYKSAFDSLMKSAVHDRIKELDALSKRIQPLAKGTFVITNATLIDGNGGPPVPDAAVLVRNGRVVSAGAKNQVGVPRGVQMVDGHGGTVLPGLWEMHAHFAQVEYGPAYPAAGVTTARDCGDEFEFITAVRDLINKRGGLGPRLILAGLVDGSGTGTFGTTWADTPQEGRAVVAKYKAAGFMQMKIYNKIKPEVLRAIAAEAHRVGMSVTGHVPEGMTAFEGVEAGMDQINHLGPVTQAVRAKGLAASIAFFKEHHTVIDPTLAWGELLSRPKNIEISSFEPGIRQGALHVDLGDWYGVRARGAADEFSGTGQGSLQGRSPDCGWNR